MQQFVECDLPLANPEKHARPKQLSKVLLKQAVQGTSRYYKTRYTLHATRYTYYKARYTRATSEALPTQDRETGLSRKLVIGDPRIAERVTNAVTVKWSRSVSLENRLTNPKDGHCRWRQHVT